MAYLDPCIDKLGEPGPVQPDRAIFISGYRTYSEPDQAFVASYGDRYFADNSLCINYVLKGILSPDLNAVRPEYAIVAH